MTLRPLSPSVVVAIASIFLALGLTACGGGSASSYSAVQAPTINSVSVSCASDTVFGGQTLQCNSTVIGTGAFNSAVYWSTSAGTISSTGLLTAPTTAGTVTVTATAVGDSSKHGSKTVTVNLAPTVTDVTVSCASDTVVTSHNLQCTATVSGTGSFDPSVTWSASAGSIVNGLFTAPGTAGPVSISATSRADATKIGSKNVTVTLPKAAFTYKGVTHVSWWNGDYSSTTAATSQAAIADSGSNWAGLLVTQYMATKYSNTISPTVQTPTDTDLVNAIDHLHAAGLKVMLKPHIDVSDGSWRGQIAPTDVAAWFQNFTTFITHYAQLAETNNVEMLCFGTEYVSMTGAANRSAWINVIAAIRAVYGGKLVYAANATSATDEFKSVSFWDNVDVIGLDAYFPLTDHADPTLAELIAAWSSNRYGENIIQDVENFASAHPNQPVVFTEVGYRSASGANMAPWDYSASSPVNTNEQKNCYDALYTVWSERPLLKGNFWWAWPVNPPEANDTDYNPRNKPAEDVMQKWLIP